MLRKHEVHPLRVFARLGVDEAHCAAHALLRDRHLQGYEVRAVPAAASRLGESVRAEVPNLRLLCRRSSFRPLRCDGGARNLAHEKFPDNIL